MQPVHDTAEAVATLASSIGSRPDDTELRLRLRAIEAELERVPYTQPAVEHLLVLEGALTSTVNHTGLPNMTDYLVGLGGLLTATASTPSVPALTTAWT